MCYLVQSEVVTNARVERVVEKLTLIGSCKISRPQGIAQEVFLIFQSVTTLISDVFIRC